VCRTQSEAKTVKSLILVLACDGLWDKLSNEEVGEIVKTQVCAEADLYHTAETLMKTSYDKGSTDNISVMVVDLSSSLSPALN
jgi:serine/threonine protein phosphatase PrpC